MSGDRSRPHIGVQLATSGVTFTAVRDAVRRIEAIGFDSVWVPDHLIGRGADPTRLEAWQLLAAAAAATTRIRLGPLVSPVTFRHPAVLAKMAATVDHISGGRLILGLGAGGLAAEHRAFGLPFGTPAERGALLEEAVAVVRALLTEPVASYRGRYYRLTDAVAEPKPIQARLPLLIAGAGATATAIAARHADLWNAIALPAAIAPLIAQLRAAVADAGRDRGAVLATACFRLIVRDRPSDVSARIAELDPVWREDPYRIVGNESSLRQTIREYQDAGADGLIVQMPAPYDFTTLERFAAAARV